MCENPDSKTELQKLEQRVLMVYQRGKGKLEVDEKNAYFKGKAIPKDLWRVQALEMGLPADMYLDIAALAGNEIGIHTVKHEGLTFAVEVNGAIQSQYGRHRLVKSVMLYKS